MRRSCLARKQDSENSNHLAAIYRSRHRKFDEGYQTEIITNSTRVPDVARVVRFISDIHQDFSIYPSVELFRARDRFCERDRANFCASFSPRDLSRSRSSRLSISRARVRICPRVASSPVVTSHIRRRRDRAENRSRPDLGEI